MPVLDAVFPLAAGQSPRPRRRPIGKTASGGLGSCRERERRRRPSAPRESPLSRSETRWGFAKRGRFYSPQWHRFLNSDQGADPAQLNQFAYCDGDPMMFADPTGLWHDHDVGPDSVWAMYCAAFARQQAFMDGTDQFGQSADLWQHSLPGVGGSVTIYGGNSSYLNSVSNRMLAQSGGATNFADFTIDGQRVTATWGPGGQYQESAVFLGGRTWQSVAIPGQVNGEGWSFSGTGNFTLEPIIASGPPSGNAIANALLAGVGAGLAISEKVGAELPKRAGPIGLAASLITDGVSGSKMDVAQDLVIYFASAAARTSGPGALYSMVQVVGDAVIPMDNQGRKGWDAFPGYWMRFLTK